MNDDELKAAAAASMQGSGEIRERVRDLTLKAIHERRFDFAAMRSVMQQITEGISAGAEQRGDDVRVALADAVKGMDEALTKTAHATQLAWTELASKGRQFGETEVKSTLEAMKRMESDFVATLSAAADKAGAGSRAALRDIAEHAARTGTDAGAAFTRTAADLSRNFANVATGMTQSGAESAKLLAERVAEATSGFLAGLSEALNRRDDKSGK